MACIAQRAVQKKPSERLTPLVRWSRCSIRSQPTIMIRAEPPSDCTPNDWSRTDCHPVDVLHPERFYLAPKKSLPQTEKFRYIIPSDLSCDSCVLQWRWWTGNNGVAKGIIAATGTRSSRKGGKAAVSM